ncbi:hypothetical protein M2322_003186 [Rhodoblastus acidophilus]|uniref:hypothetical protein n=1 Tax=Rhodoblastus acidophilus TaxID=1074 RepID=UPI0022251AE6|nr:hypothetical protein [Rhodoblastus acidophilus]MCW2317622.1 hypothetical protein [Rhodoblastus acidophilus]
MPDIPGGNPIASLYPQPPQPSQNAFAGHDMIQTMAQIQHMQAQQQQMMFEAQRMDAQRAVGNAFQGAIGDDGTFDHVSAMNALKNNPSASIAAAEGLRSILDARGKQFDIMAAQNDKVLSTIGPLAQNPNATKDDALNIAPNLLRLGVPSSVVNGWLGGLSSDPKLFRRQIANMNSIALGPGGAASRINAPPDQTTGAPQQTSLGAVGYGNPTTPTDLPPGVGGAMKASQDAYVADQSGAAARLAAVRPLEQALPLLRQLSTENFGPGSQDIYRLRAGLQTFGLIDPSSNAANMVALREETAKKLAQNALFTPGASRSNEAMAASFQSNPGMFLSKPANVNLILNQIGQEKQDAAAPLAFKQANPDLATNPAKGAGYLDYKSTHYQSTDPRAFALNGMTDQEKADLIKSLGDKNSPAYQKFARSLKIAHDAGLIAPPQGGSNGQ